jgi:tetratricopeptide (TPR) repeat protein
VPDEIKADMLDPSARAELRTLPADLAESVARHLVAASLQEDPSLAYKHAKEARRMAARVGVVREATGIAAYRAGEWTEAIAELRAARRLTGRSSSLPMIADSERALGRLDKALAVVHEAHAPVLDRATQIELVIVESGIRRDQGLLEAAVLVLQVPELKSARKHPWSARLFYAYADALLEVGRREDAREWFGRAAECDPDGETDAAERFDALDGVTLEDLEDFDDLEDDVDDPKDLDEPGDTDADLA